ncbi:hypothetical protein [Actinomadura violacea]|uniref:Uncharacterized protein n=1 Tax=Actinomadura violacea TaxID=2819934 RepID=A0ABS3S593_9ACTN|nr:hypothetical protein [Actinomadura violacea]MBO2463908.1 hypothetical protein [Actinomadura violacea]
MTTSPASSEPPALDDQARAEEVAEDTGDDAHDVVVSVPPQSVHDPACWIATI